MDVPIVLKGVIHGQTIALDEVSFLPDGYRVTLQLMLESEEALRLSFGSWTDMTAEQVADYEKTMSEFMGRPIELPGPDPS